MRATGGGVRRRRWDAGARPAPSRIDRAARAHSWMLDCCFPFWAERGPHPRGGFRERLALDGSPLDDAVSRVRVQARQTYVFARALLLGWEPSASRALVERGVASILGPCRRPDRLFGRLVRVGDGLEDDQPELYDNAFCLLALAAASRALDAPELIAEADATLARLDTKLARPSGGYAESLPPRLPRRQNPHMHLFEACLALFEASGAERHLDRAAGLLGLFEARFLDPVAGHVREQLDDGLAPLGKGPDTAVEPGHAFEWVALLEVYRRLTGAPTRLCAARLYAAALPMLDAEGFAPLAARAGGGLLDSSRRTWAQTEALRAHLARATLGDAAAARRAQHMLDAIFAAHLDPAPAGAWTDHLDARGRRCTDSITAATGYHVVTALAEAARHPAMRA